LKPNIIGIIGGILGFVSLALPWWTMSFSSSIFGQNFSIDASAYLYQVTALGQSATLGSEYWYGWVALILVLVGSILGIAGSAIANKRRGLLAAGGVLALVGVIVFPLAFQMNMSSALGNTDVPAGMGLFGSGSTEYLGATLTYSTYLTFGFWIALVGAILMLAASTRKIPVAVSQPAPPPPQL